MSEANAFLPRPGSHRRSAVAGTRACRFSRWRPYGVIYAISAKVLAFTADRWLTAAGVAAATGSAAFATLMIIHNSRPDLIKEAEYPGVFTRDLRARSPQSQVSSKKPDGQPTVNRAIDYNVTGSITSSNIGKAAQNGTLAPSTGGSATSTGTSKNNAYVLRFVHKEAALLQNKSGFYVVRRGTVLPGAGKVLSIEKLGDTWILVTAAFILRMT